MEKILKNKKIIYGIFVCIIIIGAIVTYFLKLNFALEFRPHTRMNIYIGKEYELEDIKQIAEEVFGTKNIIYQKIETFNEAVSIIVDEASDEEIDNLKNKIKEKYELETTNSLVQTIKIGNYRGRDIIKPYIVPVVIVTIILIIYVGIRYFKLGIWKTILTLGLRLIISQALLLSIIAILRLPIANYTMPVAIGVYILVAVLTVLGFQKELDKMLIENEE